MLIVSDGVADMIADNPGQKIKKEFARQADTTNKYNASGYTQEFLEGRGLAASPNGWKGDIITSVPFAHSYLENLLSEMKIVGVQKMKNSKRKIRN